MKTLRRKFSSGIKAGIFDLWASLPLTQGTQISSPPISAAKFCTLNRSWNIVFTDRLNTLYIIHLTRSEIIEYAVKMPLPSFCSEMLCWITHGVRHTASQTNSPINIRDEWIVSNLMRLFPPSQFHLPRTLTLQAKIQRKREWRHAVVSNGYSTLDKFDVFVGTVHNIVSNNLQYQIMYCQWVPPNAY